MISVLHVIDSLGTGGAEHQLTDLILSSDRDAFHHTVCSLAKAAGFATDLRRAGIEVVDLDVAQKYMFLRGVRRLTAVVRRVRPHIIHASLYRSGVLARAVGRRADIPVVTTLVNTTYEPEWRLDNPYLRPWKVAILQAIDGVTSRRWGTAFVAISRGVKHSAERMLGIPGERITVIHRGFPFTDASPPPSVVVALRNALAPGASPFIVNIGRLVPQKGQRYLIEAMRRVVAELPAAHLLIAGEGWLRGSLEEQIRAAGLVGSVTLLGERHDAQALLASADIFVFPSLYEGFGVSMLEAMAAGRPCIASDIEVLREITDEGRRAVLVPIRDPEQLAQAIVALARDP
ncbi:MAG: glycosyltransferase, partial [Candidatus Rokuibacteriota bacterium]